MVVGSGTLQTGFINLASIVKLSEFAKKLGNT
jgi:hypothetical protein